MSHGKSSRPGSSKNPGSGRDGERTQDLPSRPFSLPAGYYEYYGIRPPETATGAVQAKAPDPGQSPSHSRELLEYYGIVPPAAFDGTQGPMSPGGEKPVVQAKLDLGTMPGETGPLHEAASRGTSGSVEALPYLDEIQRSFGRHDVRHVQAYTGQAATEAAQAMGAKAYATGEHVAFAGTPSLHTAAHEAAHVIQQRAGVHLKGGVGEAGDPYERHADAVADAVVQGKSSEALLDQHTGSARSSGPSAGIQRLQLALDADLRTAARTAPVDSARIVDLINTAPIAEVQQVARRPALIREVERHMPAGQADSVRARLARRLFIDGHQALLAWSLITSDDRARRQRYLDAYGTTAEQHTFEDGVIADGTNIGYMIRAFDSYWEVEARRDAGARWNAAVIQRMHAQLKLLPDRDVRAQDVNGRVWQSIVLTVAPALIDRAAFGGGEFTVGANAGIGFQQQMGYGTRLTADVAAGANVLQVTEGSRLAVGDTFAIGTGTNTLSVDPNYDRGTVTGIAGNTITIGAPLTHAHHRDDIVTRIDARGGSVKLAGAAAVGANTLQITDGTHFSVNDSFAVGTGNHAEATDPNYDHGTVTAIAGNVLTVTPALTHAHRADDVVTRTVAVGNNSALSIASAVGAHTLQVGASTQFAVNDVISVGTGANASQNDANFDAARVTAIAGNTLTLHRGLTHAHAIGDVVRRMDERGGGARDVNWLNATVRHEIAHAVDAAIPATVQGFTAGAGIGGWWTGAEPSSEADFDTWVAAMGATAWTGATSGAPPATTPITPADIATIRTTITNAVANKSGSLFALGLPAAHPIMRNRLNNVPVIVAAEACLSRGDSFYTSPEALYAVGGKCFSISFWYRKFMYHNESIRQQRVSDYSLYAPAEFFAETYTVFYEEAGRPGVTEADFGRLINNGTHREWIRANIHNRAMAPAGVGPVAGGGGGPGAPEAEGSGVRGGHSAEGEGMPPGRGGTGRKSHRSGP